MEAPVEKATRLLAEGSSDAAFNAASLALLSDPTNADLIILRARALQRLQRYDEADRQWSHLQRVAPGAYDDLARLKHAAALIETGNIAKADALVRAVNPSVDDNGLRGRLIDRILQKGQGLLSASRVVAANETLVESYKNLMKNDAEAAQTLRFSSVVIVTYGRTGSTLLQGILNTIDGVTVLGENDGAFFDLFSFFRKVQERAGPNTLSSLPTSPFFGAGRLDLTALLGAMRNVVEDYFAPFSSDAGVRCIGFKEVHVKDNPKLMTDYLSFLEQIFPNPAFIFLWRDHEAVLQSGFWKSEDRLRASKTLESIEAQASRFVETRQNCFSLDYKDLSAVAPRLKELVSFLGGRFDADRIARVIEIPHSYNPERAETKKLFENAQTGS